MTTPLATVHRGVAFEKKCLRILSDNLSMSLRRVGGKSDGGIDLIGWWWIPLAGLDNTTPRTRLRVLAQCKAEKKKIGPNYVREMEGVLHRHLPRYQQSQDSLQEPLVALLLSESPFTKATILRALSSPVPFFLLHIPRAVGSLDEVIQPDDDDEDLAPVSGIGSAMWNPALGGTEGLLRGLIDIRWERSLTAAASPSLDATVGRPGLWSVAGKKISSWTPDGEEANKTWNVDDVDAAVVQ